MNSSRAMGSLSTLMRRWHNLRAVSYRPGSAPTERPRGDVDVLRQEELNLLVGEVAELGAEDVVDPDMVCVSPAGETARSAEASSPDNCTHMRVQLQRPAGTHER